MNELGDLWHKGASMATLVLLALAAISGGMGGCAIAGHQMLRGKRTTVTYFLAYTLIGCVFGVFSVVYGSYLGLVPRDLAHLIGNAIACGALGSVSLASTNLTAKFVLQRLGIEVQLTVKEKGSNRK